MCGNEALYVLKEHADLHWNTAVCDEKVAHLRVRKKIQTLTTQMSEHLK